MIYSISQGMVSVEAESVEESLVLLSLQKNKVEKKQRIQKHKKHLHKKVCDVCGESFRGSIGLSTHKWKSHPQSLPIFRNEDTVSGNLVQCD